MYDRYGTPMPDRFQWIQERAYYISQARHALGSWVSMDEDWKDAENEYDTAKKHAEEFPFFYQRWQSEES